MRSFITAILFSAIALTSCVNNKKTEMNTEKLDITGTWAIETAMGMSTASAENPTLITFDENGQINGCASVNTFMGEYKLEGEALTLSNIGMTRMLGASMDIEDAVVKAINSVASIKVEEAKAYVLSADNDTVLVLNRVEEVQ